MRAIRVAPVALLGAAALSLLAPATAAAQAIEGGTSPSFTPTITPATVAPGGRVTLGAVGCTRAATAFSGVFDTITIPQGRSATATVDWDAKRGAVYEVTFRCGDVTRTAALTITAGATATTTPTTAPTTSSTAITPSGAMGGLGGSVDTMDSGEIAAGAALVAAAATGTIFVMRRRRDSRLH